MTGICNYSLISSQGSLGYRRGGCIPEKESHAVQSRTLLKRQQHEIFLLMLFHPTTSFGHNHRNRPIFNFSEANSLVCSIVMLRLNPCCLVRKKTHRSKKKSHDTMALIFGSKICVEKFVCK